MYFFQSLGLYPFGHSWRPSLGVEIDVQRRLGACLWCRCACKASGLPGRGKGQAPPAVETVHIHISSVPSSFFHTSWRLLGIQSLGGPWACRTCSSPVSDCGERGAAGLFLVTVVCCPCQGGTGTN